ncbi:MAG TPA: helix-turn-helix transcriptional regulator [Chthonomonadaceae bacterium]|nr:helix-turn-helix transcriptional regulator [Chthonomonadaceae bacterium]
MQNTLGKVLKQWRTERDLSIEQLASRVGLAASTLRRWEKDAFLPRLDDLEDLLAVLGASSEQRVYVFSLIDKPRTLTAIYEENRHHAAHQAAFDEFCPHPAALWKTLRLRAGLTGQQVAAHLDVNPSLVSHWEASVGGPPEKHYEALFALYQAAPEEEQALCQERSSLIARINQAPISVDACEEQYQNLVYQVQIDTALLGDLKFLQLEAALWPHALRRPSVRPLLACVYHWHGEWLLRRGRFKEMGDYGHLAMDMMPKDGKPHELWLCGVGLAAKHAFEGKNGPRPKQGLEMWERWLSVAEQVNLQTNAYRDMAEFVAAGRDFDGALMLIERAKKTAAEPWERYAARHIHARLLCQAGKPHQAIRMLERLNDLTDGIYDSPFQKVLLAYLWTEALIALRRKNEAADWLRTAYHLLNTHDLVSFRSRADELAAQL